MNTWLINVSKGGREFGTCFYYNLLSNLWESSSFPPTANIFEGYNALLSQLGNTSISYKFNCFSFKWSKMKTNMKGCIAKIKVDWAREYDFHSVRGYGFKGTSIQIYLSIRISSSWAPFSKGVLNFKPSHHLTSLIKYFKVASTSGSLEIIIQGQALYELPNIFVPLGDQIHSVRTRCTWDLPSGLRQFLLAFSI